MPPAAQSRNIIVNNGISSGISGSGSNGSSNGSSGNHVSAEVNSTKSEKNTTALSSTHISMNFQFLSLVGPYILIGFFILLSLFNNNMKGFCYVFGIIVMLFISNVATFTDGNPKAVCNGFFTGSLMNHVPLGILVYSFTFFYLLVPMIISSMMNYMILITLMLLIGVECIIQTTNGCINIGGLMVGLLIGVGSGIVWALIIHNLNTHLTYHTDYLSDKQVCSMPSEQKFKCKVYKHGELITTMST